MIEIERFEPNIAIGDVSPGDPAFVRNPQSEVSTMAITGHVAEFQTCLSNRTPPALRSTKVEADCHRQTIPELMSDEELMHRVATREQSALGQLYQRYSLLVRKIISEKLGNAYDTEEVLQDVFITVWNCASNYEPTLGKPLGWVICMARRRAIDRLRKNRRHQENHVSRNWSADETDAAEHSFFCPQPWQEDLVAVRDLRQRLTDLIKELPVEQQHVLELAYFDDMSHRRIATVTGIPLGTIKTRLELAITKLAKKSEHLREDL